jgi:eukaryotic-like serine/threonine-protein kinase
MGEAMECPACGGELPPDAPRGLCPRCLLEHALSVDRPESIRNGATLSLEFSTSSGWNGMTEEFAPDRSAWSHTIDLDHEAQGSIGDVGCARESGRYQIFGEIARGGMGAVLKGWDRDLGRDLAVKVLLEEHSDRPELVRRFVEEARIGGRLQHPGIVPVHELGTLRDCRPYFTMKLVEGCTLADLLDKRQSADEDRPRLLGVFEQVCQTLAYAHSRGVIHCDLKPSNVMVGRFGEVQVMDWGLAKVLRKGDRAGDGGRQPESVGPVEISRRGSEASAVGAVLGTPAYMAPEQARGERAGLDERTDVFGLGAILCEILTGQPPFPDRETAGAGAIEVHERLEASRFAPELVALANRCLAPLPDDRPRDAGEVAAAVTDYLRGVQERLKQAELASVEAQARAAEERKRRRLAVGLAATIVSLALITGGGGAWLMWDRERRASRLDLALRDVEVLKLQAETAGDDPARWAAAGEAIRRAEQLRDDARDDAARSRVAELAVAIRKGAEQAEADARLLDRLAEIRDASEAVSFSETNVDYATVFRSAGFDLQRSPPEEAGRSIARRPPRVALALATALDHWASLRRKHGGGALADRLTAAARAADPDPWRGRLRTALHGTGESHLRALQEIVRSAPVADLPPTSLALLGQALFDAADLDTAESLLRPAQRRHPGDLGLNLLLAETLRARARSQEAIRYYTAARVIRPDAAHLLAHALIALGEPDEAIAVFRELARFRPSSVHYMTCLGRSFRMRGLSRQADVFAESALAEFREGARVRADDPQSHLIYGMALGVLRRYDDAVAEYREAIRLDPAGASAHVHLADALRDRQDVDGAIAEYREAIRLQPDFVHAYCHLGSLLCDIRHDPDAAAAAFREAIRLDPDHAPAHYNLGNALKAKGLARAAIAEYREAIRLQPDFDKAHTNLGIILEKTGEYAPAVAAYREAIRYNPRLMEARMNLGLALARRGQIDEALAEYREAIRLQPDNASIRFAVGNSLFEQRRADDAVAAYREAIRLDPRHSMAHCNLGRVLAEQGKSDEAMAEYREAIRLEPQDAEAHCNLGLELQKRGAYRQALVEIRRGHELGSKRADWHYPSAQWVRDCERLAAPDPGAQAIDDGAAGPAVDSNPSASAWALEAERVRWFALRDALGQFLTWMRVAPSRRPHVLRRRTQPVDPR